MTLVNITFVHGFVAPGTKHGGMQFRAFIPPNVFSVDSVHFCLCVNEETSVLKIQPRAFMVSNMCFVCVNELHLTLTVLSN
jgi:hypothetical protein